ncbi:MAG TPA: 30S ribosomal protein S17 [Candidatus Bathyarchaeia archaeon]|nr:30S ribosomal protein S17 [Candidatus Bathyarchaeia archaeon]
MKMLVGKVISTKMDKTAVVAVETKKAHPLYKKAVKKTKKYHVHDELGVEEGAQVKIAENRPLSKTKRWRIAEVVKK